MTDQLHTESLGKEPIPCPTSLVLTLAILPLSVLTLVGFVFARWLTLGTQPDPVRARVVGVITVCSVLYMLFWGFRSLRPKWPRNGHPLAVGMGQVLLLVIILIGWGLLFAWLFGPIL